ncbi:MAG: hypothetical protein PHD97_05195 [Bacteroidales bacterium]|nr:hypothetical protein [Bacteroidales bacterium]
MAYNNISVSLTDAQKVALRTSIAALKNMLPFLINLTPAERKRLRKTGNKRLSYVLEVLRVATANPQVLPTSFSLTEFTKDVVFMNDLAEFLGILKPVYEGMEDTMLAVGNEAIREADEVYGYLKVAGKKSGSQALNISIQKISNNLKQNKKPADDPQK